MAIKMGDKSNSKKEDAAKHDIKVTRAKKLDEKNVIMFDMEVNGISIYGCSYRTLERRDGSGDFGKVGFPSHKASDNKYYSYCWFKISDEDMDVIEKGIEALI